MRTFNLTTSGTFESPSFLALQHNDHYNNTLIIQTIHVNLHHVAWFTVDEFIYPDDQQPRSFDIKKPHDNGFNWIYYQGSEVNQEPIFAPSKTTKLVRFTLVNDSRDFCLTEESSERFLLAIKHYQ